MAMTFCLKTATLGLATFALTLGLATTSGRAEDVKMFKTAPSVEELEKALGTGPAKHKTRSIVLDDAPAAVPAAAPAPQYAAPPPQYAPQQQPQYAPQPAPQYAAPPPQYAPQQQPQYAPPPAPQYAAPPPAPAPAPAAAPPPAAVGNAVGFPINFDINSANLRPDTIPFLQSIAGLMQKDPSLRLVIEGHTDAKGDYLHNVELSRARATSVMNFLISGFGIAPARLQAVGKGPMEPLSGSTPLDPANRRVQFRVMG
jgi:outer membrane protein OmpA-like peptidoglycan-associated protein